MTAPSAPIVGIDLGTTNSLVAVAGWPPGPAHAAPRCLPDAAARVMLPSVVSFDDLGRVEAIGHDARARAVARPAFTISSIKRLMGRSRADAAADLPLLSYSVIEGPNRTARVALPTRTPVPKVVSPQEVSAVILAQLKRTAEQALGLPVARAVITVPAYFDDAQRQATRDAARIAGLDAVRIINEPTAAALAYGLGLRHAAGVERQPRTIAVYDLGGGTFDVSILRITPGESVAAASDRAPDDFFEVLSTAGDTHLGGDDMDAALMRLCLAELDPAHAHDLSASDLQELRRACELAKIALSDAPSADITATLTTPPFAGPFRRLCTRAEFESAITPLAERTLSAFEQARRDAARDHQPVHLDAVVLVGGATRIPLVRRRIAEASGLTPYTALDPDQVVALGAAVYASVLAGSSRSGLLLDVIPLSLGLETVGGAMAKMIIRNSTVPARASELFSTSVDNQTGIKLHVLQGEREMAADCRSLARLELKGIPPMPAGLPKLRVDFLVDASGILTVRAVEERSSKRLEAQIVPSHGLTSDEVERIERDSLLHARDDMTRHRVADLISHSQFDLNLIERQLARHAHAIAPALAADLARRITALKALIAQAKSDHTSVNPDAMQQAKEALDRASIPLHEASIAASLRDGHSA